MKHKEADIDIYIYIYTLDSDNACLAGGKQILLGNFRLNYGVPWLVGTNSSLCLICK